MPAALDHGPGLSVVAEEQRRRWAATASVVRAARRADPSMTVGRLLAVWLLAAHGWRPSTVVGYRSVLTSWLLTRSIAGSWAPLTPGVVRAACNRCEAAATGQPTVWARVRVLRSAVRWAYAERIVDHQPLDTMRGPPQPRTRQHVPVEQVVALLHHAEHAVTDLPDHRPAAGSGAWAAVHRAEQVLLLTRLAADSDARRGELAALRLQDLDGRVLTIERAASAEVIGPTKTGRIRRLTLGATPLRLWHTTIEQWEARCTGPAFGPWLFSTHFDHATRITTTGLAHWFAQMCGEAGLPGVTLHRLQHSVATVLVGRGGILQAQYRLGHANAYTTVRTHSHAQPLHDATAADTLEALYR